MRQLKLAGLQKGFEKLTGVHRVSGYFPDNYNEAFRAGLTIFTPEGKYLNIKEPLHGRRPYANFLFVGTTRNFLNKNNATAFSTQLDIGVIGTYAGREAQAFVHRMYKKANNLPDSAKPYDPVGWHNQISDGGEPTFLYGMTFKKLLTKNTNPSQPTRLHHFDATASTDLNLGFYNSVGGTIAARAGWIRMPWHQFNSFPVPEAITPLSAMNNYLPGMDLLERMAAGEGRQRFWRNTEAFAFLSLRSTAMAYSVPLQGQFRRSEVTLPARDVAHLISQVESGIVLSAGSFSINGTYIYRTRQFKTAYAKDHSYFSVGVTVRTPYYKRTS